MELNILEETKNKLVFEVKGESHTLCNTLKKALWAVPGVKLSGYNIKHPLVGIPKVMIETDSKITARDALNEACKSLKKDCEKFSKAFDKEVK